MRSIPLAVVACTFFLAACGGDSEEDKVKQAFNDYVEAVKDADGDKYCDSVASPELAEASRDDREREIELCKDDFDEGSLREVSDQLGDPDIVDITVKGDAATGEVKGTVNGKRESSQLQFLKVDGDWKLRFESR